MNFEFVRQDFLSRQEHIRENVLLVGFIFFSFLQAVGCFGSVSSQEREKITGMIQVHFSLLSSSTKVTSVIQETMLTLIRERERERVTYHRSVRGS